MNKRFLTFVVLFAAFVGMVNAQTRKGLHINEVMVQNEESVIDDFGRHSAWIELFNSNFAPLEISSVYLTNDKNDPTKYPVPLGDVNTKIPKRQHVLFWADGLPTNGTFHTNFVLVPGQENWIGLYDADGKTLLDEITIPANLPAGASYARIVDGEGQWQIRDNSAEDLYITPSSNNRIKDENPKVRQFAETDKSGVGLTIMAMCIVFSALILLCLAFYLIGSVGKKITRRRKMESMGMAPAEVKSKAEKPAHDTGEEIAAIAMALYEHLNVHDQENTVLTINKVRRSYSPWSSKIYSLREVPARPTRRR